MSEPWSLDYRGLAIVPVVSGDGDAGYAGAWKIARLRADGNHEVLQEGQSPGRHATEAAAQEAAIDAGQTAVDRILEV